MESLSEFEHLKIPLHDIISATNNFDDANRIGAGGFGTVYKGLLPPYSTAVAVKRLSALGGDFSSEIVMLSRHGHSNLVGFCNEGDETILVYEHPSNGSLDNHFSSAALPWARRLKLCLEAATALTYLHGATANCQTILHRDVKSSNILLDEHYSAKLSDFGLSRMTPRPGTFVAGTRGYCDPEYQRTRPGTFVAGTLGYCDPEYKHDTLVVGTRGYCAPEYKHTRHLSKPSDVYSFGLVIFELLSGRRRNSNDASHVRMSKKCYKQNNNLQESVFNNRKQQMDRNAPTMSQAVEKITAELELAMLYQGLKPTKGHERWHTEDPGNNKELDMITVEDPLINIMLETELKMLKGTLINRGRTWFSLDKEGRHCEMISIAGCLTSASEPQRYTCSPQYSSRFAGGCYDPFGASFKTRVQARFLSPGVAYAVNLVFKNKSKSRYIGLEYKLNGELGSCYSFVSDEREDGWLAAELYQFTTDQRTVDLEICFYTECCPTMLVEGIEFRPLKKADHEVSMDEKVDMQLDIQTYFDDMLSDYEDMVKRSKDSVQWKTKKDLFSILCKGFQFSYGEEWFYLDKHGKKCLMLPARAILEEERWTWTPEPETRFEEVACCNFDIFSIYCKFSSKMLSPQTAYAAFLVYELPDDHETVYQPSPVQVVDKDSDSKEVYNVFLRTPQTPVISWNEKEERTFNPLTKPNGIKGLPKQRSDGWMEVQVHEFQTRATIKMVQKKAHAHEFIKMISTRLKFSSYDMSLKGVIVQGLEFRPAV